MLESEEVSTIHGHEHWRDEVGYSDRLAEQLEAAASATCHVARQERVRIERKTLGMYYIEFPEQ